MIRGKKLLNSQTPALLLFYRKYLNSVEDDIIVV